MGDEMNTDLELDLSVVTQEQGADISLSDLYGMPVFKDSTKQAIIDYENKVETQKENIDRQVFSDTIDTEKQSVQNIREQVFVQTNQLIKPADVSVNNKQSYTNAIILLEVVGIAFILLMVAYSKKRKRERKKNIDHIDHFSDETKDEY